MNLLQIRQKLREISGRVDLVNSDYSDNGADFYINEGSRYLDRLDETQKSWASCFRIMEVGQFALSVPYCRAIKEVWITETANGRRQLDKKNIQDLITGYLGGFPSERTNGTPLYYSPCLTRSVSELLTVNSIQGFVGMMEVPAGNANEYNSILLNVPVQYQTMVDVRGLFYQPKLVEDTDTNYWSEVHPMLLLNSTMRQTEITNRNTQGVKDWENVIIGDMRYLGFDLVEEMIAGVTEMGEG
jgi:hypothetical protein